MGKPHIILGQGDYRQEIYLRHGKRRHWQYWLLLAGATLIGAAVDAILWL